MTLVSVLRQAGARNWSRTLSARHLATTSASVAQRQNYIERVVQRYAVDLPDGHIVRSGDVVAIRPEHVLTHDNTGAVMSKFTSIGAEKFKYPRQPVFALDHDVQNKSPANLDKYARIEAFAKKHNVDFYPAGRGIGHQIMIEEGYAFPGTLTVASDSHSNMYGGVGCVGTPLVRTDAAALWATGQTWWQVPPVVRCELTGKLPAGVSGKDVIVTLCGELNKDEVLNCAVEFTGDGVRQLSVEDRLAIANMSTEWGALAGVFPVDEMTLTWLREQAKKAYEGRWRNSNHFRLAKDKGLDATGWTHPRLNTARIDTLAQQVEADAKLDSLQASQYAKHITLDLSSLVPSVSGPNSVKLFQSVTALTDIPVNKAYLVSCVNSRAQDIRKAADVMRGQKVANGVEFYVAAASSERSLANLLDAGAKVLPAGCGPCIGLGAGLLEDGEVGISATNRNFKGRMGSLKAKAYLASPAVVAASAIHGYITSPNLLQSNATSGTSSTTNSVKINVSDSIAATQGPDATKSTAMDIIAGFPKQLRGEIIFCPADNLNTDGIYPGKYTYKDDLTKEEMARAVMENYDPKFVNIIKEGDILVSGFNFGTGSSREQAATALLHAGIRCVVAGSFSETYKRNAVNNALVCIEAPELVRALLAKYGRDQLTVRTGEEAVVNFAQRQITKSDQSAHWPCSGVGRAAQDVIASGGLESWVRQRL
ncbi:homoaconitase [Syncephalis fuscata]|nr:homoaconitase [Syncephalis fuscata]